MGGLGEEDACKAVARIGIERLEGSGFCCWHGAVHLVATVVSVEGEA